ncbi:class I SAM-dependent methyltransferase [Microbacterium sp. SLBN-146]|uniref:class I SAM-dependent methyltransferase n=1 Tax=Microbacterium sp. SLBN-146 TaxID=2768457 RepID=UPI001154A56B|nr:methyltransferase [Microbacterium sp. SLBN-146]TQJ31586.1 16S rRNA (guanine1207-N2)-methyltransferase [Microbacterium sp. SLBN-146]
MTFSLDGLRRWPDHEAPELVATDAADRLLLDESADARAGIDDGDLVVIGDDFGALTLGSADAGARGIRVHQDPLTGERALAANAAAFGLTDTYRSLPLTREVVAGARVVLLRLPRSLAELRDVAGLIALYASEDVVVYAGGRVKHMSLGMNDVLREFFGVLDVTHARQKSRVLIARGPVGGREPIADRTEHDGLVVLAYGGVFAGTSIDIGTRLLLAHLPADIPDGAIDYACGSGVIATSLVLRHPTIQVLATDRSAAAVASARATAEANGVGDRVRVVRDDLLGMQPDASTRFIALNPPFHSGAAVTEDVGSRFFRDAARVLVPGGELWTVWNSGLPHRSALERVVGPTQQVARNAKFTVTRSTRR